MFNFCFNIFQANTTKDYEREELDRDPKVKKKLSMRTTAENEKAHSPGHSLCSECGK